MIFENEYSVSLGESDFQSCFKMFWQWNSFARMKVKSINGSIYRSYLFMIRPKPLLE